VLDSEQQDKVESCLERARLLAIEYYVLTGKPLGVTGEVGEYWAARLLGLTLADARTPGYDAIGPDNRRIQIKSRSISSNSRRKSQRIGGIKLTYEWDTVVLVLMNEHYDPVVVYEAKRDQISDAINAPGSKARNERGALAVSKFKSIASLVWQSK
jgi:hypothetical protein